MEKITMIFRKAYNPYTKRYESVAFIPETSVSYGRICCYQHIGQHSEAALAYYNQTKKATFEEYKDLFEELKRIYDDMEIVIKQRLNYDTLRKSWY